MWVGNSSWGENDHKGLNSIFYPALELVQSATKLKITPLVIDSQVKKLSHVEVSMQYKKADLYACTSRSEGTQKSCKTYNIGSEIGTSVLSVLKKIEHYANRRFTVTFQPQRTGEVIQSVAMSRLAQVELGWEPKFSIDDIIRDDVLNSGIL